MTHDIQIYVADLASYHAGYLHGVWIDATLDLDDIQDAINMMLAKGPTPNAEEWAIHDYEGFEGVRISEYEGIERVHDIALFIEERGKLGAAVLDHWCEDLDQARKTLEENYSGEYESIADYAQSITEETSEVPEHLTFYIDYEKMGRDMELSGDIYTIETGFEEVHVFWSH